MSRLFVILLSMTLAACSSGVSNSGAGGAGTDTGDTDLIATAVLQPETFSSDAFATVVEGEGEGEGEGEEAAAEDIQLVSADFADMEITITDPLGRWSRVFQGATFTLFRINFLRVNGGAPNLGQRDVAQDLTIVLDGGTGSGSVNIPLVDNVTKKEFRQQQPDSGTPQVYTVQVRAFGRDFATNTQIVVEARATIEIGEFVEGE